MIVEVEQGWGPKEVGDALQEQDVIKSSAEFQQISQTAGVTVFAAGRYVFLLNITAQEALNSLRGGPAAEIPDIPLLLPPGLTIAAIADRVGRLPGKSKDRFLQVVTSGVVRSKLRA